MAKPSVVKILHHFKVSPPQNSVPNTSLPLTFFDIPWLFFSQGQTLFFYECPHPTSHFLSSTLPKLNTSLSLTLQHFFLFAGNLSLSHQTAKPEIVCTTHDHVSFTIAESTADFYSFTSSHPRDASEFYHLVPHLPNRVATKNELLPLFAVQVTVFSNLGLCLGFAYHHVVCDGRTFNNFVKTWASFCRSSDFMVDSHFSWDRTRIFDTCELENIFLHEWRKRKCRKEVVVGKETKIDWSKMFRATFVVSLKDMEKIKLWIVRQCKRKNQSQPVHLSPYVLTCSFIWVCYLRAQTQVGAFRNGNYCSLEDNPIYFGFVAGGLTRLDYLVPSTYLGNCVGFGRSEARLNELIGEDGIVVAANVIGNKIKELDRAMFIGADKWISDWDELFGSELHVIVVGSPKLDLYDTEFGWGRTKKIEEISIDSMRAISLTESKDMEGGIEIGLTLPKPNMDAFSSLFDNLLSSLQ